MSTYYNCYKVVGYDGDICSHAGNMAGDGSCLVHHFVLDWNASQLLDASALHFVQSFIFSEDKAQWPFL